MDNNTETREIWTNQLSNENHQIVVASDGEIVTRHIFNQPTNQQTKKDALLIAASPELLRLLKNIVNCQFDKKRLTTKQRFESIKFESTFEQQKAFKLNTAIKEAKDYIDKLGL